MDALDSQIQVFLLALVRTTSALTSVPVLSERGIPVQIRVALGALLSFLVLPAAGASFKTVLGWERLVIAAVAEVGVGLFIGLVVTTIFEAVAIACRVIETQAGFSLGSSIFDAGGQSSLGSFYHAVALVLFFTSGAYRELLRGLASTFSALPVGSVVFADSGFLISAGSHMFVAAVHFGAPIVGGILLADVALGLLSRAAPQMNVFSVGFPVKIGVALALAAASMGVFAASFSHELHAVMARLFGVQP